jgi:hypothetical protein
MKKEAGLVLILVLIVVIGLSFGLLTGNVVLDSSGKGYMVQLLGMLIVQSMGNSERVVSLVELGMRLP